jgi:hypothetical protein
MTAHDGVDMSRSSRFAAQSPSERVDGCVRPRCSPLMGRLWAGQTASECSASRP